VNYFITENLNASLGLSYMNIINYHYEKGSKKNINISAGIKYNF